MRFIKSDERIKKDVVSRLSSDSRVDASGINMTVEDGKVVLNGTVPTYSNKFTAERISRNVFGVTAVDNQLVVEFPSSFTVPTDDEIRNSVEQMIKWNADVDEEEIVVNVDAGAVTLEGTVPTYWQRMQAEDSVSRARGVVDVTNKLAVVPTEKVTDDIIGERIMDRLEQSVPANVDDINVKVEEGEVTLTGVVPTYVIWHSVYETVRDTIGVVDIRDDISVSYA